jgi:hypothetical protein
VCQQLLSKKDGTFGNLYSVLRKKDAGATSVKIARFGPQEVPLFCLLSAGLVVEMRPVRTIRLTPAAAAMESRYFIIDLKSRYFIRGGFPS